MHQYVNRFIASVTVTIVAAMIFGPLFPFGWQIPSAACGAITWFLVKEKSDDDKEE